MTSTAGGLPVGRPPVLWRAAGADRGLVHQDQVPDARRQAGAFPSAGGEFRRRPGGQVERAMISAIEKSPNGRFYPCSVTQNLLQCMSLELADLYRRHWRRIFGAAQHVRFRRWRGRCTAGPVRRGLNCVRAPRSRLIQSPAFVCRQGNMTPTPRPALAKKPVQNRDSLEPVPARGTAEVAGAFAGPMVRFI